MLCPSPYPKDGGSTLLRNVCKQLPSTLCHILQWAPRTSDRLHVLRHELLRLLWFRAAAELWHKTRASCSLHENMSNVHVTRKWAQPGVLSHYFQLWYRLYYVVRTWGRQQVLPGWLAGRRAMPSSREPMNIGMQEQHTIRTKSKQREQPSNKLAIHNTAILGDTLLLSSLVN